MWRSCWRGLSASMELWTGIALDPVAFAEDLQRAGYARVGRATQPGDFEVGKDALVVKVPAAVAAGIKIPAAEILITVDEGRVSSISPGRRALFAPTELAAMRGPDNEARLPVPLADLPRPLVDAVLAMEDSRFWEHEGLDPLGILRALLTNAIKGGTVAGGSTLTQQLVKNLFLTEERTYERKAREAVLAIAIERTHSKEEILELYLNEIYLGQAGGASICGVDQAARAYFGKPATRLELGEAATIGGMISAPNRYSPLKHPDAAQARRDLALQRMVDVGWLDAAKARAEIARSLSVHAAATGRRAPWTVDSAIEAIEGALGEGSIAGRGISVHTTVQPALQALAERSLAEGMAELIAAHPGAAGVEAALVAVRISDGAVVAMVGGRDYQASQFDRATSAVRQIGSTVKPLTALVAFDRDPTLSPASLLEDQPIERVFDGKTWRPKNYDGIYKGPVTIRETIVHSRNIPAVLLAEKVGFARLEQAWQDLGLSRATALPSAALGSFGATPLELASAYTVFAGSGKWTRPSIVRAAVDSTGAGLWSEERVRLRRADPKAAWQVADMLAQVLRDGTGKAAPSYGVRGTAGGKTGTTDDGRDAWFAGYTAELAVAVWVGFDRTKALGLSGATAALPSWARFVAGSGTTGGALERPKGLESRVVCVGDPSGEGGSCAETATEWLSPEAEVPAPQDEEADAVEEEGESGRTRGLFRKLRDRLKKDKEALP